MAINHLFIKRQKKRLKRIFQGIPRLLTAFLRPLPNTLIMGVQKGGSTAFFMYLTQNPQVSSSTPKETRFFTSWRYALGSLFYRHYFPLKRNKVILEATPGYLFKTASHNKIHRLLPKAKLLIVLRDPLSRAYSAYHMKRRNGLEKRSFLDACLDDLGVDGRIDEALSKRGYMQRGYYFKQIQHLLKFFPREQLYILQSSDLKERTQETMNKVCDFLEIEHATLSDRSSYNTASYPPMDASVKEHLMTYFSEDQKALKDFLKNESIKA